jgi:hypothetical protein
MYRYVEISNCFLTTDGQIVVFVGGNLLRLSVGEKMKMKILLNRVNVEFTTSYVSRAVSMIPCFKFGGGDDIIILTSKNFYYHVDTAG